MHLTGAKPFARRIVLLAVFVAASEAQAQDKRTGPEEPEIRIGSRVRVLEPRKGFLSHVEKNRETIGTVSAMDEASITVLAKKRGQIRVLRASEVLIQVSRGRRSQTVYAIRWSAGVGLLLGGVGALLDPCYGSLGPCASAAADRREQALSAAAGGVAVGALIGLVTRPPEKWGAANALQAPRSGWQLSPTLDLKGRGVGIRAGLTW